MPAASTAVNAACRKRLKRNLTAGCAAAPSSTAVSPRKLACQSGYSTMLCVASIAMSVNIQLVPRSGLDQGNARNHSTSGTTTQSAPSSPVSASSPSNALWAWIAIAGLRPSKLAPCSSRFHANSPNPTPSTGRAANIAQVSGTVVTLPAGSGQHVHCGSGDQPDAGPVNLVVRNEPRDRDQASTEHDG